MARADFHTQRDGQYHGHRQHYEYTAADAYFRHAYTLIAPSLISSISLDFHGHHFQQARRRMSSAVSFLMQAQPLLL